MENCKQKPCTENLGSKLSVKLQFDSSALDLRVLLERQDNQNWKPVPFASHTTTKA